MEQQWAMLLYCLNKMITNKTKGRIIARKVIHCRGFLSKSIGLMFSKRTKDKALVFYFNKPQNVPLHMFFVFYPIDVVYLKNNKVVEIKQNFRPFTAYNPSKLADIVIELPEGTIKRTKTSIGDKIAIK
jgi:uncharacterized protein